MMKTKLTLFVSVLAAALFMGGCASTEPAFVSDGLVAYYPLNGNANDESGNGNNGAVNGATLTTDRNGNTGEAYSFDGNSSKILVNQNNLDIFGSQKASTISFWINPRSFSAPHNGIITKGLHSENNGALGNRYLQIETGPSKGIHYSLYNSVTLNTYSTGGNVLSENIWQHVVIVRNAVGSIYVNGIDVTNNKRNDGWTVNYNTVLSGKGISIGASQFAEVANSIYHLHHFDGTIDDVRIYNRALSAKEVKALYDLEKPKGK